MDALLTGLDAEQRAAVTIDASPLAIIAAAGSGKTTVLARRIAHRIATDPEVHAQHVLALTFTNQAAQELHKRLRTVGVRERVEAGTFHAIARRLLRERAGDQGRPMLNVTTDKVRLMQEALKQINAQADAFALLADLDWCRARRLAPHEFAVQAQRAGRRSGTSSDLLGAAATEYATVKRRRGVQDFDDLLEQFVDAMTTDRLWADGIRWRFRHLFVDEVQDINHLQYDALEAIRDRRPDICVVGDPRQAIFGFNGADPEILNSVERLYPGATVLRLHRNYRCSPQIVAAARAVLEVAEQADDSVAMPADGATVALVACGDDKAESADIARLVRDSVGVRRPWRSCAILARTVAQLTEAAHALHALGVPCNLQGKSDRPTELGMVLAEAYAQRSSAELATWVDRVGSESDTSVVRSRVAEAADRFVAKGSGLTFRAWVELHAPFDDLEDAQPTDAVELLTFHGAKGREWPIVFIIGAEVGLIPHTSAITPVQRAEEARLLYVGCTRAREHLTISWATSRKGRASRPTALIADIAAHNRAAAAEPAVATPLPRAPRPAPEPVYAALVEWRQRAARAAQVAPAAICSDESLRAVAQLRPTTIEAVAGLTDLGPLAAARIAPRLLGALKQALEVLPTPSPQR